MASKYIKWDITNKCNLRCAHCSVGKNYFAGETDELPIQQKLEIVDKLADAGVEGISLLGGEPLMMGPDLTTLVRRAVARGLEIHMVTNGLLLTGRTMEELADCGLDRVVVSLEGATQKSHEAVRGRNTYDKVVHNIGNLTTHLQDQGLATQVVVNTVLNRLNLSEIDALIDLCLWLGVDEWTALSLIDSGFAQENLGALMLAPEQEIEAARTIAQRCSSSEGMGDLEVSPQIYPLVWDYVESVYGLPMRRARICCNASISLGFIGPDGNLYPCDRIAANDYVGYKIGESEIRPMSLVEQKFYEIWNSDYYLEMFELILNDETYSSYSPCSRCGYFRTRYCNPCPLYSLDAQVSIKSCLIAEEALGDISGPRDEVSFLDDVLLSARWTDSTEPPRESGQLSQSSQRVPSKRPGVRCTERGNALILMNPYAVEFVGLDEIGEFVWDSIDGQQTIGEISAELHQVVAEALETSSVGANADGLRVQVDARMYQFFERLHSMDLVSWKA